MRPLESEMNDHPLTFEQIWGVPEEQLPETEIKDYFDYVTEEKEEQTAESGSEDGPGGQVSL